VPYFENLQIAYPIVKITEIYLAIAANETHFLWLLPENRAFSLWCRYRHCIVSNPKRIRKMSTLPLLEKLLRTPWDQ